MKIPLPEMDKLLHFFFGFIIAALTTLVVIILFDAKYKWLILLSVILAGVSKELYDKFIQKEQIETWDIYYTIVPGIIITIIAYSL